MRSYTLTGQETPILQLSTAPEPFPHEGEVIVDIHAVSLNYRDLIVAGASEGGGIPTSDGAGVVSALGTNVAGLKVGDRVAIGFMPGWVEGEFSAGKQATSLGGPDVNGVLVERIAVSAAGVCQIPDSMTFEEAATLPCAGVTAWSALFERRPVQPGETVLLLGTGGVSIFALQLAKAAGARVIITSSSDEKLKRARALGADHLINYREQPDWEEHVLHLTDGIGADLAVDVAGPATLNKTLKATRHGGRISLMGVLSGFNGHIDTGSILEKRITLQGIYVGPVATLKALIKVPLKPVIDRVYAFEQAEAAFQNLRSASHFGKLVVRVAE
ncbi:zinc-dependent alcohol dehydrogenase family protein [Pseudomonas typographi]|uniref:zinc-dependent alcohol dehydrogenase family protein n=1 Tax=Pseudomonas typographi TaxID=2715964 RepID=UPI001688FF18|nr:NAD(P)-dependent alcohol dehydrogenase [Pseudomonas typographi]MBD1554567.1 NAD(P)-dependent alcohol dehydrogenase [Pseudomonas typographi]MBD1588631.1 NAD(P)-dependent alcohol dehydrogenase [Pseudomonas typographi]